MPEPRQQESFGELLAELFSETRSLVCHEVTLVTAALTGKAKEAAIDAGIAAAGGAIIHAGLLVLLAAVVLALTQFGMAPWVSALIVAFATIAVGYTMVTRGVSRMRQMSPATAKAVQPRKETVAWTTQPDA